MWRLRRKSSARDAHASTKAHDSKSEGEDDDDDIIDASWDSMRPLSRRSEGSCLPGSASPAPPKSMLVRMAKIKAPRSQLRTRSNGDRISTISIQKSPLVRRASEPDVKHRALRRRLRRKDKHGPDNFKLSSPKGWTKGIHVSSDLRWEGGADVWDIGVQIGKGAFGSVHEACYREMSSHKFAIKVIPVDDHGDEELAREVEVLKKCHHTNIVQYYGSFFVKDKGVHLIMDLCFASVLGLMEELGTGLNGSQVASITRDVLNGLAYLHKMRFFHRDLKAANILLGNDHDAKLADFGVADKVQGARDTVLGGGTMCYMPPEVLGSSTITLKMDIWSLGITCIEMAQMKPPRHDVFGPALFRMILEEDAPTFADAQHVDANMVDFVATCLHKEPTERPSAEQLLTHPFITQARPTRESMADPLAAYVESRGITLTSPMPRYSSHSSVSSGSSSSRGGAPRGVPMERKHSPTSSDTADSDASCINLSASMPSVPSPVPRPQSHHGRRRRRRGSQDSASEADDDREALAASLGRPDPFADVVEAIRRKAQALSTSSGIFSLDEDSDDSDEDEA